MSLTEPVNIVASSLSSSFLVFTLLPLLGPSCLAFSSSPSAPAAALQVSISQSFLLALSVSAILLYFLSKSHLSLPLSPSLASPHRPPNIITSSFSSLPPHLTSPLLSSAVSVILIGGVAPGGTTDSALLCCALRCEVALRPAARLVSSIFSFFPIFPPPSRRPVIRRDPHLLSVVPFIVFDRGY